MIRALLINPYEQEISETSVPEFTREISKKFGGKLVREATLPNGDGVYVTKPEQPGRSFRLGGSEPFTGFGIVLGRRGPFGAFRTTNCGLDAIADIVTFEGGDEGSENSPVSKPTDGKTTR
jgi:hypothetical protein